MLLRCGGHLAASLSSVVEAEWIWDSKEVINLHIGDMSAEQRRKKIPNKLTHKGGTCSHSWESKKQTKEKSGEISLTSNFKSSQYWGNVLEVFLGIFHMAFNCSPNKKQAVLTVKGKLRLRRQAFTV